MYNWLKCLCTSKCPLHPHSLWTQHYITVSATHPQHWPMLNRKHQRHYSAEQVLTRFTTALCLPLPAVVKPCCVYDCYYVNLTYLFDCINSSNASSPPWVNSRKGTFALSHRVMNETKYKISAQILYYMSLIIEENNLLCNNIALQIRRTRESVTDGVAVSGHQRVV